MFVEKNESVNRRRRGRHIKENCATRSVCFYPMYRILVDLDCYRSQSVYTVPSLADRKMGSPVSKASFCRAKRLKEDLCLRRCGRVSLLTVTAETAVTQPVLHTAVDENEATKDPSSLV